jgi:hypothetical protein
MGLGLNWWTQVSKFLNQLASNSSKAEALQSEIEHILNGLPRVSHSGCKPRIHPRPGISASLPRPGGRHAESARSFSKTSCPKWAGTQYQT